MISGRLGVLVWALAAAAATLDAAVDHERLVAHARAPSAVFGPRAMAIALCAAAGWRARRAGGAGPEHTLAAALVGLLVGLGSAALVDALGWVDAARVGLRSVFVSGALVGAAGWTLASSLGRRARPGGPALRRAVALGLGVVAVGVVLEAALAIDAVGRAAPILWTAGGARATVERFRPAPGAVHLGEAANAHGYNDAPFVPAGPERAVIALVADSFGFGIVPRARNFTRIAELALAAPLCRGGPTPTIYNFGVPAIGVPEYAWLLAQEVPAFAPSAVVVALYPANDLPSALPPRRRLYNPREWRITEVTARALRLATADRLPGTQVGSERAHGAPAATVPTTGPPRPTLSRGDYRRVTGAQLRALDPDNAATPGRMAALTAALERMRERAPFPLVVVLIPSELQVSPPALAEAVAGRPQLARIDPDVVHARIGAALRERDFAVLDLLPRLRDAERIRPTHHPRDSHWNVWGNEIAGRAVAAFLEEAVLTPMRAACAAARVR